jgi:hypothetical protein
VEIEVGGGVEIEVGVEAEVEEVFGGVEAEVKVGEEVEAEVVEVVEVEDCRDPPICILDPPSLSLVFAATARRNSFSISAISAENLVLSSVGSVPSPVGVGPFS